uniref:PDZ domain-containing protein n=1 Tax=Macrostomum lignano TaxID=282301 RepID=A0A1I8H6K7_9PLAT
PDLCQQSLPNFTDQGISTSLISLTAAHQQHQEHPEADPQAPVQVSLQRSANSDHQQHQEHPEADPQAPVQVSLQRSANQMWGFRLQGGADYRTQLTVMKVEPESAAFGKLHSGDAIQSVNGQKTRQLSHAQASSLIKESGNSLTLIVVKQPGAADSLQHIRPQGKPKFKAPKK